jgi:hypothetical protein
MTRSISSHRHALVGVQRPRLAVVPPARTSAGREAIELAAVAGLHLDDWEAWSLEQALGERPDGKWAAFEVGTVVARQNGKGSILEARELAGALLFGERLLIHSAHEQATSSEHHLRLVALIEEADFQRRIKRIVYGKGSEAIEFKDGTRILFKTRTGGGGRGFTGDFVALDEAMILAETFMGALVPTMAARSVHGNPQLWYAGSVVDQMNPKHDGVVLSRLRSRALKGEEGIAYLEWSIDAESPDRVPLEVMSDPVMWAESNPGLGIRISEEYVRREQGALAPRTFCVERLSVGDWVDVEAQDTDGITAEMWRACRDEHSVVKDPVRFAVDVTPNRERSAICAAGERADGLRHVEVVEHRAGTSWVVDRAKDLLEKHDSGPLLLAARSPAAALIQKLVEANVPFEALDTGEFAQACGAFFDDVKDGTLRHLGTPELTAAATGAVKRRIGDAWAWSRTSSGVDISPLVAATLARFAASGDRPSVYEERGVLVV